MTEGRRGRKAYISSGGGYTRRSTHICVQIGVEADRIVAYMANGMMLTWLNVVLLPMAPDSSPHRLGLHRLLLLASPRLVPIDKALVSRQPHPADIFIPVHNQHCHFKCLAVSRFTASLRTFFVDLDLSHLERWSRCRFTRSCGPQHHSSPS